MPIPHIRSATALDMQLVFDLVRELAAYEHLGDAVDATPESLGAALFGTPPQAYCEIAMHGDDPVGFVVWFYSFSTFRSRRGLWLEDIFVRPAYRGKGCGRALFEHLGRRCVREGLARMEWSVLDWNAPSIAFYRRMGAAMLDQWTMCRLEGETLRQLGMMPAKR